MYIYSMARRRNISKQTRRVLSLLAQSGARGWYGYEISKATGLKSGSLYPMLMRLSEQGFLESNWEPSAQQGRPPRHIYTLSGEGRRLAQSLLNDESLPPIAPVSIVGAT